MSVRAGISSGYRWRLGLIGIGFTLFGLWSLYDGLFAYPHQQEVRRHFDEHREAGRLTDWPAFAQERGWSDKEPKARSDFDILSQFVMAALVLPVGLLFTAALIRSFGRWVEMDGPRLRTSSGADVGFDQVVRVDDARWKRKGISHVYYRDPLGAERRIVLDDWKFERDPIDQMHSALTAHLNPEGSLSQAAAPATAQPPPSEF